MFSNQSALAIDDRGKRVAALRPRDVRDAAHGPDAQRSALARHLRNAISAESRRWTLRGWSVGLGLLAAWLGLLAFGVMSGLSRQPVVSNLLIWGGLIGVAALSHADTRRRVASQLAATAVAEGICGSCCYSLHDLVPEADGCLVCPECGAAWRSRRITRPHWLAAAAPRAEEGLGRAAADWIIRVLTLTPSRDGLLAPDDRGRFVPIVDSRLYLVPRLRRVELGPERTRDIRRALRRIHRIPRVLLALVPLGLAALSIYAVIGPFQGREVVPVMLIPVAFFLLVGIGLIFSHAFYSSRLAARVMLARSLCPSCAGPLSGLPADADGCAVCPECGASWRPPTIGR